MPGVIFSLHPERSEKEDLRKEQTGDSVGRTEISRITSKQTRKCRSGASRGWTTKKLHAVFLLDPGCRTAAKDREGSSGGCPSRAGRPPLQLEYWVSQDCMKRVPHLGLGGGAGNKNRVFGWRGFAPRMAEGGGGRWQWCM